MNFAPAIPEPNFTRDAISFPRSSEPKMMTRFGSKFVAQSHPCLAIYLGARQRISRRIIAGKECRNTAFFSCGNLKELSRLPTKFDRLRIDNVQPRPVQPDIVANLPGEQWMLIRRIVTDQQDRGRARHVVHAGGRFRFST